MTKLTEERIKELAHRRATKYTHCSAPHESSYGFTETHLADLCRDINQAIEAEAQKVPDAFPMAHRLALELECLILSCDDNAAVSKWWDSSMEALEQWREFCQDDALLAQELAAAPVQQFRLTDSEICKDQSVDKIEYLQGSGQVTQEATLECDRCGESHEQHTSNHWCDNQSFKVQQEAKPDVCHWNQEDEDGAWDTTCNHIWLINEGTPTENRMKFCHGCGKPIAEHPWTMENDDGE